MKSLKLFFIGILLAWCGIEACAQTNVTIADEDVTIASYTNSNIRVEGKSNLVLTDENPLINSTIDLVGENAWLYFESLKPSKVAANWTKYVTIGGRAFNKNKDRIAIYASGAVIIPNGLDIAKQALTVYTGKNFTGESRSYEIHTYHKNLGDFDNKIKSFKLKKGFSAGLANNSDGTGFSRYFIASDEDLEFAEMPEGLEFVSFIRVFKWEWSAKKGWAGGPSDQLNVSIFNTWGGGQGEPNMDRQFVPMRHNAGWEAWSIINAQEEVSQLLGFNEPDRPDQANMTFYTAISQWPEFFKSGLRIGSPAPASTNNWLKNFMNTCDSLNYRVDFMVTHAYQYQNTGWWDWYIDLTARGNRSLEEAGGRRPVWITEWNNGANWTGESWPTASGPKRDANLEILKDDSGNEITVNKPLSPENSARSVAKMQEVLPHFENIDLFEHHFLYNWVQDARSMELDGVLTPAGKYFAGLKSKVGFKKENEYIHKWKIAPPWILTDFSNDYKTYTLQWYDHNGETGKRYILQQRIDDGEWTLAKAFVAGEDYNPGAGDTLKFSQTVYSVGFEKIDFRVYAVSYKDTRSIYSRTITFKHDAAANAPAGITGEAISSTILKLKWDQAANARSYRIERATSATGEYETIGNFVVERELTDKELKENTTYYYRIYSINSRGESIASATFQLKTKELITPVKTANLRAASGDGMATLTWNFVYDALYNIYRSDSETADYELIASDYEVEEGNARYKDTDLKYKKAYYYKVVPFNRAGTGPDSDIVTATPSAGQHLHLSFKENTGTAVYDEWGGYHAEFQNKPTWGIGRENESAVFLSVADKSHLLLPKGVVSDLEEEFTIASWLYLPENAGNNTRMFDFGNDTGTFMVFIPKYNGSGQARYKLTYFKEDGVQYAFQPTFAYNFPLGEWAHVAFTVQKFPQGGLFFMAYLNGQLVGSSRDLNNLTPSGMGITETNYLGRSQWPNDPYCAHGYDDFRIYTQALSRTQIQKLYKGEEIDLNPVSIDNAIINETLVSVAPNPVFAGEPVSVTISCTYEMPEDVTIRIFDIMGGFVAQYKQDEPTITIPAPTVSGTYIVNISSSTFSQSSKLIVK